MYALCDVQIKVIFLVLVLSAIQRSAYQWTVYIIIQMAPQIIMLRKNFKMPASFSKSKICFSNL